MGWPGVVYVMQQWQLGGLSMGWQHHNPLVAPACGCARGLPDSLMLKIVIVCGLLLQA